MRELTSHEVNPVNRNLRILADAPGASGASYRYLVQKLLAPPHQMPSVVMADLRFQDGPLGPNGTANGLTHEALLAILEDRLKGFQTGIYACTDTADALFHIREAQRLLGRRTAARDARGVEGQLAA